MVRFAAAVLLALLFAGPVSGGSPGSSGAAGGAEPRLHRVVIQDFAFRPPRLEVRPGDSIEWMNLDLAPHTASAEDGTWNSGELAKRASFRTSLTKAGSHVYRCAFHPTMRGEIVVAP